MLVASIDGCAASHVCPTRRGLGSAVGLSAWQVCGAVVPSPANCLTCGSLTRCLWETVTVRGGSSVRARGGHALAARDGESATGQADGLQRVTALWCWPTTDHLHPASTPDTSGLHRGWLSLG